MKLYLEELMKHNLRKKYMYRKTDHKNIYIVNIVY